MLPKTVYNTDYYSMVRDFQNFVPKQKIYFSLNNNHKLSFSVHSLNLKFCLGKIV